jgi:hypothetical protein
METVGSFQKLGSQESPRCNNSQTDNFISFSLSACNETDVKLGNIRPQFFVDDIFIHYSLYCVRAKMHTVVAFSAQIVGSNRSQGMDVCRRYLYFCFAPCIAGYNPQSLQLQALVT